MPLFQTNPKRTKTAKVVMAVMLRKEYLIGGQYLILLASNQNPQPQKHQLQKSNVIQQHRTWIELLYLAKMKPTLRIDRHFEVTTNGRQQMERIRRI